MTSEELAHACNEDGEFQLAARRWHGAVQALPTAEGPERFRDYLLPVLKEIQAAG